MNAFEKAQLKKKYGWSGERLADLCGKIIKENQAKIAEAVATTDKRRFERNLSQISPKRDEKKIILPDVSNVVRRSSSIIKAADQGELVSNTIRERMRKDLKQVMIDNGITTKTGKVNRNIAIQFEKKLKETYKDYVKKTPGYNMPANIHTIAVTETRSAINSIRHEYTEKVAQETGPEYLVMKKWVHNDSLSKKGRPSHERLSRRPAIMMDEIFDVNGHPAVRPHDPRLPPEEFIGCNCELEYKWIRAQKKD